MSRATTTSASTASSRSAPRSRGEETRRAILKEALAQATKVGLEGLSIGGLAKETGMSKSGLFAHFGSKEDLQVGVLDFAAYYFVRTVVKPAIEQPRGEPRIHALVENWFRWERDIVGPGGCIFIAASTELDDRPGPVRDKLVAEQRRWIDALARSARIAIDEGHFRPDLDAAQFAFDLFGIILVYHYYHRLLRAPDSEARARHAFEELLKSARV
ncbi:MAG: TetR/AcrR family transcriptional regulator [Acidobacteriota bacterium]